jgi:lipopolysaccharide transport system ATP-binding protein
VTGRRSNSATVELPDDVLLSVQGVSRAESAPPPQVPAWLKRILPKSGLAGRRVSAGEDFDDSDDPDDELEDDFEDEAHGPLVELTFDVRAGEGVGIVGMDNDALSTLVRILSGALPPTTGRIVMRGRVAPLLRRDLIRLAPAELGLEAVMVVGRYLHWPLGLIRSRWDEIREFARLEELENMAPHKYEVFSTARLLFSAALHMDATIYLIDHQIQSDRAFTTRCVDLVEQRKAEGACVVQRAQKMVDDVSRLCDVVYWFENGTIVHKGRPVDVAVAVSKAPKESVHPLAAPLTAALANGGERVEVGPDGTLIDVELHVLRPNLDLAFWFDFEGDGQRPVKIEKPDLVQAPPPGVYRLRVGVPPRLLEDGSYTGKLLAEISVAGGEPTPPRELLSFDVAVFGQDEADRDAEPTFEWLAEGGEDDETPADEVEWRVSRATS